MFELQRKILSGERLTDDERKFLKSAKHREIPECKFGDGGLYDLLALGPRDPPRGSDITYLIEAVSEGLNFC